MSIATASTFARERRNLRKKGTHVSLLRPSPTNTTSPPSRSNTSVQKRLPLAIEISSMAIRRRFPNLGREKRRHCWLVQQCCLARLAGCHRRPARVSSTGACAWHDHERVERRLMTINSHNVHRSLPTASNNMQALAGRRWHPRATSPETPVSAVTIPFPSCTGTTMTCCRLRVSAASADAGQRKVAGSGQGLRLLHFIFRVMHIPQRDASTKAVSRSGFETMAWK